MDKGAIRALIERVRWQFAENFIDERSVIRDKMDLAALEQELSEEREAHLRTSATLSKMRERIR